MVYFLIGLGIFFAFKLWLGSDDNSTSMESIELDEKTKCEIKSILDIGIKILQDNILREGGFVKIFFEISRCQIQIHLTDTRLLQLQMKDEERLSVFYGLNDAESEYIFRMTDFSVADKDHVRFIYDCYGISKSSVESWIAEYLKTNYPKYEFKKDGNTLSFLISKYR